MNYVYLRRVLREQGHPETLAPYDLRERSRNSEKKGHAYLPLSQVFIDSHDAVHLHPTIVRERNLRPPDNVLGNAEVLVTFEHGKVHLAIKKNCIQNIEVKRHCPSDSFKVDSLTIVERFTTVYSS